MAINFKKHERMILPDTPQVKGLRAVMGGIFLLTLRLMVTNGLDSLAIMVAGVLFLMGFYHWRNEKGSLPGMLLSLVLSLVGFFELTSSVIENAFMAKVSAILLILAGFGAGLYLILRSLDVGIGICSGKKAIDTAEILTQRKWWVLIGYSAASVWAVIDVLTGWMPNIGVIMRVIAIVVDVFVLSAFFQVQKVLAE